MDSKAEGFKPVATNEVKYVVLASGMGAWKRGDVIGRSDILSRSGDVDRLLRLNSVRVATEAERGLTHVDLPSSRDSANMSYEHRIAEHQRDIMRLNARVVELEQELADKTRVAAAGEVRGSAELIAMKDKQIADLTAKLSVLIAGQNPAAGAVATAESKFFSPPAGLDPSSVPTTAQKAPQGETKFGGSNATPEMAAAHAAETAKAVAASDAGTASAAPTQPAVHKPTRVKPSRGKVSGFDNIPADVAAQVVAAPAAETVTAATAQ